MHRNWLILISCALSSITNAASAPASCPLLGPVYPPPRHASRSLALAKAKNEVVGAFQKFVHGAETPGASVFDPNTTSISLEVFAAGDSSPLLYTSYTATSVRDGTRGVRKVDEDTVFRIGSCSKLWTIFLLLIENGDASFQEPIAKYIPELRDAAKELKHNATEREDGINIMHWNEVTVGELASQLAGLTRDYGMMDLAFQSHKMEALGFPQLPKSQVQPCGKTQACNRSAFLDGLLKSRPIVPIESAPVYSNAAFQLIAYAMEEMTGKPFQDILKEDLIDALHLTRSSYNPPKDKYGIIPDGAASFWNLNLGDETPAGGIYSSTKDMATLGRAILNSTLLPPVVTRRWMKPASHTSEMENFVGAPWEIYSLSKPRVIDMYTKAGDLGMYSSTLALLPDYNIGFTVLVAGANATMVSRQVSDLVVEPLIPLLDVAAKEEAVHRFSGAYAVENGGNSSITITTDDGPGMKVTEWINDSHDMLESVSVLYGLGDLAQSSVRLYPTGLESPGQISFRAIMQGPSQTAVGKGPFSLSCMTWVTVDSQKYGNVGIDEFLFDIDSNGDALSVSPRVMRKSLPRKTCHFC